MSQASPLKLLSLQIVTDIAQTILASFNKHYRLFRAVSRQAKVYFETAQWKAAQQSARERISFYEIRVKECVVLLENVYGEFKLADEVWREIKLHYMELLIGHMQPALAETFFNTVCTKMLNRRYYRNDFIFVRPAIATDYLESDHSPLYRVYYPAQSGLQEALLQVINQFELATPFVDLKRDVAAVAARLSMLLNTDKLEPNHQLKVLFNLFN